MTRRHFEITCPHCRRSYALNVDPHNLDDARATARCGRCNKRFRLASAIAASVEKTTETITSSRGSYRKRISRPAMRRVEPGATGTGAAAMVDEIAVAFERALAARREPPKAAPADQTVDGGLTATEAELPLEEEGATSVPRPHDLPRGDLPPRDHPQGDLPLRDRPQGDLPPRDRPQGDLPLRTTARGTGPRRKTPKMPFRVTPPPPTEDELAFAEHLGALDDTSVPASPERSAPNHAPRMEREKPTREGAPEERGDGRTSPEPSLLAPDVASPDRAVPEDTAPEGAVAAGAPPGGAVPALDADDADDADDGNDGNDEARDDDRARERERASEAVKRPLRLGTGTLPPLPSEPPRRQEAAPLRASRPPRPQEATRSQDAARSQDAPPPHEAPPAHGAPAPRPSTAPEPSPRLRSWLEVADVRLDSLEPRRPPTVVALEWLLGEDGLRPG